MKLLERVEIARPCSASWDAMQGDERVRSCDACSLNVYNLSGLSRAEAEALLREKEGRLCVRILRRADGTVITRDCPVALAALRRRLSAFTAVAGAFVATLLSWIGFSAWQTYQERSARSLPVVEEPYALMGDMCIEPPAPPQPIR